MGGEGEGKGPAEEAPEKAGSDRREGGAGGRGGRREGRGGKEKAKKKVRKGGMPVIETGTSRTSTEDRARPWTRGGGFHRGTECSVSNPKRESYH